MVGTQRSNDDLPRDPRMDLKKAHLVRIVHSKNIINEMMSLQPAERYKSSRKNITETIAERKAKILNGKGKCFQICPKIYIGVR